MIRQGLSVSVTVLSVCMLIFTARLQVNAVHYRNLDQIDGQVAAQGNKKKGPTFDNTEGSNDPEEFYKTGVTYFEQKKFKEAVMALDQAIRLKPRWAEAYFYLGQSYYSLGRFEASVEQFKRAVSLKPDWAEAHYRLGWAYYVIGKQQASLEHHKILQKLDPDLAGRLYDIIEKRGHAKAGNKKNTAEGVKESPSRSNAAEDRTKEKQPVTSTKQPSIPATTESAAKPAPIPVAAENPPARVSEEPATKIPMTTESAAKPAPITVAANNPPARVGEEQLTNIYRVGAGDVLNIKLADMPTQRSTLYTVMENGTLDYELVGQQLVVKGLTIDEIKSRLTGELKQRGIQDNPNLLVSVREYSSHTVIITGLVAYPGARILRREAVPLYVLLAEAQPRQDASRAIILRKGTQGIHVDLNEAMALNELIYPNDVIMVSLRPPQFYYIGGQVIMPGQKVFRLGLTLMQAVLSAGGTLPAAKNIIEISQEGQDGRLTTSSYSVKDIKSGKVPDPRLRPGDLIEVR